MKNLKNLLPVLALVLGLGLVLTQSAFKSGKTTMTYQYDRNDAFGIDNPAHWNNLAETPQQSCSEGTTLPCIVQFDSSEYVDLDAFLATNDDAAKILSSGKTISKQQNVNP
ncbi:MAG: hypothetical protein EOO42_04535 [Flavobacteriales bacterium]|nr:MAG: hypothetical protein EOO42_04535 [Flavobacteriales bacterium]